MQESKSCTLPLGDIPLNPAINQRNTAGYDYSLFDQHCVVFAWPDTFATSGVKSNKLAAFSQTRLKLLWMSRPIRFIGYAMPTAHGRVYCLSISNPFRYHAYHIISKWKDIVINKNHLFTSHWSLFSLFIPLKNHLCGSFLRNLITFGNTPESPTTTPHGQWSHLSGKVFYTTSLVGWPIVSSGKMTPAGLEPCI